MTTRIGQNPDKAGRSKLSLAHDQVSPRFGANPAGSHSPGWEDKQEDGVHVLFVDVIKSKGPPALGVGPPRGALSWVACVWNLSRTPMCDPASLSITATTGPLTIPEQNWRNCDFLTQNPQAP